MKNYYINSELLKTKTTKAYSILYNIKDLLNKIEDETNSSFHEINSHSELGKQNYESIKNEMKNIEEYMDKYKKFGGVTDSAGKKATFSMNKLNDAQNVKLAVANKCTASGGFPGEYVEKVDAMYLNGIQSTIAKLRDSKLADIKVDNNIGACIKASLPLVGFLNSSAKTELKKDKIGIEDLFKYGRISLAMQKEYEEMKPEIYAYNDNLYKYESEFNNDFSHSSLQKYLLCEQINDKIIDSYDKYIDNLVNQANFNYATRGESAINGILDFSGLGPLKMGSEAIYGKNIITGEEYSDGQRKFTLATLAGGSLLGKVISKINVGKVSNEEIESVENNGGFALSMNGAGEYDNLLKKITEKVVGENKAVAKSNTVVDNIEDTGIKLGTDDLKAYRAEIGVPDRNTVAVGKTDIIGLENYTFKGASPQVRTDAGLPHLDDIFPDRDITAPYVRSVRGHSQFMDHAEENVIAEFEDAINKAGLNPEEVEGALYIHQSNPDGVCNKCTKGLFKDVPYNERGIFKQLTDKYPNLEIKVTTEIDPNLSNPRNTLSFDLKNGETSNVVQIRKSKNK